MSELNHTDILLISDSTHFKQMLQHYYEGKECDLRIFCQGGNNTSVLCHRFVLSMMSDWMNIYLSRTYHQDEAALILPQTCSVYQVRTFLDKLYSGLATKQDIIFDKSLMCVAETLGFVKGKQSESGTKSEPFMAEVPEEESGNDTYSFHIDDFAADVQSSDFEEAKEDWKQDTDDDCEDELPLARKRPIKVPLKQKRLAKKRRMIPENLDQLQSEAKMLMKNFASDPIHNVSVQKYDRNFMVANTPSLNYFHALCAISMNDSQYALAKPLCWTDPEEAEFWPQFETTVEHLQELGGFSKSELIHAKQSCPAPVFRSFKKLNLEKWKVKYSKLTEEKNREILEQEKEAVERFEQSYGEARQFSTIPEKIDVIFTEDLPKSRCENIVLFSWATNGVSISHFLPAPGEICGKLMIDVWYNYRKEFELQVQVKTYYDETYQSYLKVQALERVLAPVEYLNCDKCGYKRKHVTGYDKEAFTKHVKSHELEAMDCGCNLTFDKLLEKKRHFELFHSNLERIKCEQCKFIGTPFAMERHVEFIHKIINCACETCGEICRTANDLKSHKNLKHNVYKCKKCEESIIGYGAFTSHQVKYHGKAKKKKQSAICDECGLQCTTEKGLAAHILNLHTDEADKPFKCSFCGAGFGDKHHVKRHEKGCAKKN